MEGIRDAEIMQTFEKTVLINGSSVPSSKHCTSEFEVRFFEKKRQKKFILSVYL